MKLQNNVCISKLYVYEYLFMPYDAELGPYSCVGRTIELSKASIQEFVDILVKNIVELSFDDFYNTVELIDFDIVEDELIGEFGLTFHEYEEHGRVYVRIGNGCKYTSDVIEHIRNHYEDYRGSDYLKDCFEKSLVEYRKNHG